MCRTESKCVKFCSLCVKVRLASARTTRPQGERTDMGGRDGQKSCVIAVVIFVVVTVLAITARFLYRRKETYRNQEVKGVKQDDSQDFPFNNQTTDSQDVSSESRKEYFI
uniref:Neurexin/syndecan/glycophorin C domain-containing protein n=1 Tax=Seriola lalandi dorsalis TaxID=1841481 RepID=A0A3B4WML4_SERLL